MQAIDHLICKAKCDLVTDRRRKNRYTQPINKKHRRFSICLLSM